MKSNKIWSFEPDEEFIKNHLMLDEITEKLLAGMSEEEFKKSKCPFCQNPISLSVSPRLNAFSIRCSTASDHFFRQEEVSDVVEWWKKYIGGGWLICE